MSRSRRRRNRSPWFSLGYLLMVALIVLVVVLLVLWLA
jgi:predicted nucleic acid-binding Zn ribbon protein